jgi:hypothetical protein
MGGKGWLFLVVCGFENLDVNLDHFHHGLINALGLGGIFIGHELAQGITAFSALSAYQRKGVIFCIRSPVGLFNLGEVFQVPIELNG